MGWFSAFFERKRRDDNYIEIDVNALLDQARTIAVIGLSGRETSDSYKIAHYLQQQGYRIIPVNPDLDQVLGEKCYPRLEDIPFPVDLVNVFRRSQYTPEIIEQAVRLKIPAVWLQLGIRHPLARQMAEENGLALIENQCIKIEHMRRNIAGKN